MATIIRLNSGNHEPFKEYRNLNYAIRGVFTSPYLPYIRPIIAKGNIIEGLEAKW